MPQRACVSHRRAIPPPHRFRHSRIQHPGWSVVAGAHRFAEVSGLELIYPASLASGSSTQGLSGRYSTREGLAKLLEGTGLTYRFTKERSVTLEKAPDAKGAMMLNTLSVEGATANASAGGGANAARM